MMSHIPTRAVRSIAALDQFECLGSACADTCCKGWGMQLTADTVERYRAHAPELLEAIASGEAEHIMKRDPSTDHCVKLEGGWCGIHRAYGTDFLGDACHFFPRSTRAMGDDAVMSASLSCPEVVRLALWHDDPTSLNKAQEQRVPYGMSDYLPEGISAEDAYSVHRAFIEHMQRDDVSAEHALMHISIAADALSRIAHKDWAQATPFYLRTATGRMPTPQAQPSDAFNLVNILCVLLSLSKTTARPRLEHTLAEIYHALAVHFDAAQCSIIISDRSSSAYAALCDRWERYGNATMQPMLKRWCAMQLSVQLFPYAGQGANVRERSTLMAVRYAITRLALMCLWVHYPEGITPPKEEQIRVVQSIARFMDHLADPTTLLSMLHHLGWMQDARLAGVLQGDVLVLTE
jgi:lysine-N-methylase